MRDGWRTIAAAQRPLRFKAEPPDGNARKAFFPNFIKISNLLASIRFLVHSAAQRLSSSCCCSLVSPCSSADHFPVFRVAFLILAFKQGVRPFLHFLEIQDYGNRYIQVV
jgi:hypothetical protein